MNDMRLETAALPAPTANGSTSRTDLPQDVSTALIIDALRGLQYGVVSIIVQDGVVVQVERTEKHRIRRDVNTKDSRGKRVR
jgi:hypothetical protein